MPSRKGSMLVVPASMAPPEPRILSTKGELDREEQVRQHYIFDWMNEHPYPGVAADKLPWLGKLHEEFQQEEEESFYSSQAPQCDEVAVKILMERAPQKLSLQMMASKDDLEKLASMSPPPPETFFSLPKLESYKGEATWKAYLEHLLSSKEDENKLVTLGFLDDCDKTLETGDALMKFVNDTGLDYFETDFEQVNPEAIDSACHHWCPQEYLGENLYRRTENRACAVCFKLELEPPTPAHHESRAFLRSLKEQEKESEKNGSPRTYILIPKNWGPDGPEKKKKGKKAEDSDEDSGDEEEVAQTGENYVPLWLPLAFKKERARVADHFRGEGETAGLKARLQKGNTDSGNITFDIFRAELEYMKYKVRGWDNKFTTCLALLMAATDSNYWMHDNECWEDIPKLAKDLAATFRTKILKMSDEEIGLGLGGGAAANSSDEMSASRRALYGLLSVRAARFEGPDGKIQFNWKPGKPRKRKAPPTAST